jgi:DHA1 family bicyclomycin/chloramphenicol resistance-like MFS transporter
VKGEISAPRAYPAWLPILLGFLQAVGAVSTDMYLPAFQAIDTDFHAQPGAAQLTLATWILGLAFGQIVQGSLADRFGRRMPLLLGTAIYTVASAGCAMAPSIAWLACWRFIAALGGSASMIVPRAMVRDVSEGHEAAHLMARLILILGVAPILAPSLGGLVLKFTSWRGIFWITTGYGALGLVLTFLFLPDTLAHARRVRLHLATMLQRYGHILTERTFMTHALLLSAVTFGLFAYISGTPTVFVTYYHLSPQLFALLFGCVAANYILCSQLNIFVVRRLGLNRTLHVTTTLYVVLSLCLLVLARSGFGGLPLLVIVMTLAQGLAGFMNPTGMVGALSRHAAHAGSASAVMGTMQFVIGSSSGFLMAWITDGTPVPMAALILAAACAAKTADLCRPGSSQAQRK